MRTLANNVKPIRRWYRKHETENPYKVAAQVYVGVLSQPQLYHEGNHRTGSLIASGILLQSGCPPFVLTRQNAVAYFNPSSEIKFTDKRSIRGKLRLPKYRRQFRDFLQQNDFFEKVQSQEKRKPGTMSKLFSSHPPTDDRIRHSQEIIQKYLKAKPEYVVNTSEFEDVKARTMAMHNRRKLDDMKNAGRPTLRRNPNGQIDSSGNEKSPAADQDDRPTLKRRDDN